ncbi:MAG: PAC2 family protein [Candidatus Anstonellales archaeon]
MTIKIKELKTALLEKPTLIIGFTGIGLVGSISATYLVDTLEMELIGIVEGKRIPPIAAIHNYKPLPPIRIYASRKLNLYVAVSEAVLTSTATAELAHAILSFAKEKKVSRIICLAGMDKADSEGISVISSDRSSVELLEEKKIATSIKEGATTGVSGMLLAHAPFDNIPVVAVLVSAAQEYGDPEAAIKALRVLSQLLKIKIDTRKLEAEAKVFKELVKQPVIQSKIAISDGDLGGMYG